MKTIINLQWLLNWTYKLSARKMKKYSQQIKTKKRYSGKRLLAGYNAISAKRKEVRVSGILETERERSASSANGKGANKTPR